MHNQGIEVLSILCIYCLDLFLFSGIDGCQVTERRDTDTDTHQDYLLTGLGSSCTQFPDHCFDLGQLFIVSILTF